MCNDNLIHTLKASLGVLFLTQVFFNLIAKLVLQICVCPLTLVFLTNIFSCWDSNPKTFFLLQTWKGAGRGTSTAIWKHFLFYFDMVIKAINMLNQLIFVHIVWNHLSIFLHLITKKGRQVVDTSFIGS